ncbi:MAG: DUF4124 domain-containing protein [Pseudomonadota bacterium]
MIVIRLLALSGLLLAQSGLAAPLYKVVGPNGKVSFTDQPPVTGAFDAVKSPVNQSRVTDTDRDPFAASLLVYGKQLAVESGARFCMAFAPGTAHEVVVARDAWRSKNGALNEKKTRIIALAAVPEMRDRQTASIERDNETLLEKMRNAPLAERVKWCRDLSERIASLELDSSRNPTLVRTIMAFKVPE